MNLPTTNKSSENTVKKNATDNGSENISNKLSNFNMFLVNISNKLELSQVIYHK